MKNNIIIKGELIADPQHINNLCAFTLFCDDRKIAIINVLNKNLANACFSYLQKKSKVVIEGIIKNADILIVHANSVRVSI